ncbi:MAG: hypothetical protein CVT59_00990 [Actinobacteria bacterium HGW-Actinobacteria-1]|jgi:hypothetical protein|nr:MAG: hypothetical protein CVT59_00990 [Actinobacteria bacterium HGW-Actinobacteria-1]
MDTSQAIRDTENALRDFISAVLSRSLGSDWVVRCGVSPERLDRWAERRTAELSRQAGGAVEERLIYFADFYDLKTILKKHWAGEFSDVLGDWKTMDVYLSQLEYFRDPSAHGRDLLPHQRDLICGITGEIRGRIVRYRSKRETAQDCFPRFESVRDSLGNVWTAGQSSRIALNTEMVLRPGDTVDFMAAARDPEDGPLEYSVRVMPGPSHEEVWQVEPEFRVTMTDEQIGDAVFVYLQVRSSREYHARGRLDDEVTFIYTVLPRRSV